MDQPIYTLKVSLRGLRPAIWRRVQVPADLSLFDVHRTLQAAMGWTDSHLHQFVHQGVYYGAPDREFGMPVVSERRTRLGDLLQHPKDRLIYEYDFGDSWEHDVVLELIAEAEPGARYPRVVAGKRACPLMMLAVSRGTPSFSRRSKIQNTPNTPACSNGSGDRSIPSGST
jgi:hypothetical protein